MPNHSRKNGNKLTSSSIASRMRKNTMDALLQRQHNLSSKLWIKLEKKARYGTNLPFRVTSSKKFKNKTFPLYLVILELYPSSSRAQSTERAVWRRHSVRYFSEALCWRPQKRPPAQMVFVLAGNITARQHKCANLYWRAIKMPASTDTLYAGRP